MKAIVCDKYGPPDVLQLREVVKPTPESDEVLIRVHGAVVTNADCTIRKGRPFIVRLFAGLRKPRRAIPGSELAGKVEAVGREVKRFREGDEVFGSSLRLGAHAEYVCLSEEQTLATKPTNLSYEEAAAIVEGGLTALHFLRNKANIQKGQKVLINGASGSVGTSAVQLAKYFGTEVTGVCSSTNVDLVKSLGADHVIDYTREDFTKTGRVHDIIFDAVGKSSYARCKGSLGEGGVYLTTVPKAAVLLRRLVGSKRAVFSAEGLRPPGQRTKDLILLKELIEAGKLKPVIDRRFPLHQIAEAHRYVETGRKKGNVVVTLEHR